MIPTLIDIGPPLANHLWQSTLFAVAAGLLTLFLRKNQARARHWLWLAASVKFVVPFSLLIAVGSQFEWRTAPTVAPTVSSAIEQITQPFVPPPIPEAATSVTPAASPLVPALLVAVWLCGCSSVFSFWSVRRRRIRTALKTATPLPIHAPIDVMSSPTNLEPGVFGVFRPVLLLPAGIAARLTPAQLKAILAHELCHVRRLDNLTSAIHMAVEAVFWFHPLVWWIGARLIDERERACDEEVLRLGSEPEVYAAGILNVCKFYLESPLPCASGVTGSDLKKRIEAIMTNRILLRMSFARRLMLAAAAVVAVAGPIGIGIVNAPRGHAQSQASSAAPLVFEVASIKPAHPDARGMSWTVMPGGGMRATNVRLRHLIEFAYNVDRSQISGAPGWFESEGYDVLAKPPESSEVKAGTAQTGKDHQNEARQRLQALLADRFQLVIHRETKEMPVYVLVVAKNGPKLEESTKVRGMKVRPGNFNAEGTPIDGLAQYLTGILRRLVVDRTGLKGTYDFKLEWTPDQTGFGKLEEEKAGGASPPDPSGPSIFTALQQQLGLKLESQRGPVEIIVIDRAEKPSAN
jgi:uncharacterized protein (TIGR03435 family)